LELIPATNITAFGLGHRVISMMDVSLHQSRFSAKTPGFELFMHISQFGQSSAFSSIQVLFEST
jgi:hypothetical protein